MNDFLKFKKKMLTPVIIQMVFWIGVVVCVLMGLVGIVGGIGNQSGSMAFGGLLVILVGPLIVRIYCELLIVIFSINDTLTEIKNSLKRPPSQ